MGILGHFWGQYGPKTPKIWSKNSGSTRIASLMYFQLKFQQKKSIWASKLHKFTHAGTLYYFRGFSEVCLTKLSMHAFLSTASLSTEQK